MFPIIDFIMMNYLRTAVFVLMLVFGGNAVAQTVFSNQKISDLCEQVSVLMPEESILPPPHQQ